MKKVLLVALLLIGLVTLFKIGNVQWNNNKSGIAVNSAKKITVQQKILGQADFSSYQIEEGKNALDLLDQTASFVATGEKENSYVVGINGIKADEAKKEFWSLYVNGKVSSVGAGSYKLKNRDKIEWKIENY